MVEKQIQLFPGTRVMVFDSILYKDDVKTPLTTTMKPATVIKWYGQKYKYSGKCGNLISVKFDHRKNISKGHFADHIVCI